MILFTISGFFKALIALFFISKKFGPSAILLGLENREISQLKANLNMYRILDTSSSYSCTHGLRNEKENKNKNSTNLKVNPFDKGSEFVIMEEKDAIKRIEEQIGKSIIIDYDLTTTLLNKFQKELTKLRKEGKFDNKTYYKFYQSVEILSRLYGVTKVHKPKKTTRGEP